MRLHYRGSANEPLALLALQRHRPPRFSDFHFHYLDEKTLRLFAWAQTSLQQAQRKRAGDCQPFASTGA